LSARPTVPAFRADGSLMDLADPRPEDIDFSTMANALSKIARFNGIHRGAAYSVAQHSAMGADALFRESGDAVLAGYFLLHDGHEYLVGDWTRPSVALLKHHAAAAAGGAAAAMSAVVAAAIRQGIDAAKAAIDRAVWQAAALPDIGCMPLYARQVKDMDDRMLRAEALALFGPAAAADLPAAARPVPRLTGAIEPWGAGKAEMAFIDRLERYLRIVVRPA
jgi:hypothetical protein